MRAVRVQGEGARDEIAAAIGLLNRVGRADGPRRSTCSSWVGAAAAWKTCGPSTKKSLPGPSFNRDIPIVTGIGHEDDYTIADMVADLRGLTPTDAAAKAVPDRTEKLQCLGNLDGRLRGGLLRRLDGWRGPSPSWPTGVASGRRSTGSGTKSAA